MSDAQARPPTTYEKSVLCATILEEGFLAQNPPTLIFLTRVNGPM